MVMVIEITTNTNAGKARQENQMNAKDFTWQCDSGSCEHETDTRHERGAGVYCAECAAKKIALAFDQDAERADQDVVRGQQRKLVPQD